MRSLRRTAALALLLAILPACGESVLEEGSAGTGAPGDSIAANQAVCTRITDDGCTMVGIRLDPPLPLGAALDVASDLGGAPIAVWRTDAVCVPDIDFSPVDEPGQVPSRFAYVDADGIARRRMNAVERGLAPPITGLHISQSYWDKWIAEWRAARSGASIEAIAMWVPIDAVATIGTEQGVAEAVPLEWRRTDSIDPGYLGELLLTSRVLPGLSEIVPPDC